MKKYALISLCLFFLALTLGAILAAPLNAATVEANVEIYPDRVDLGAVYPKWFKVKLWFSGKYKNYKVTDINRITVLVEAILSPKGVKGKGKAIGIWEVDEEANTVTFKIKGEDLVNYVIWPKVYHMARVDPNPDKGTWFPYNIDITVTGEFTDGTPFSGTDTIKVYVPQDDPPPPPP